MSDHLELVAIREFPTPIDAEIAQGALEAAGIESVVSSDDAGGQYANLWLTGVRLLVRAEDEQRAREVLDSPPPPLDETGG